MPPFGPKCLRNSFEMLQASFTLLVGVFVSCPILSAQISTGKITGSITDSAGASIVGATVRATNQETAVVTTVNSQESGSYLLNFLIPGRYTLEVESPGFETNVEKDVEVTGGGIAR